MKHRFKFFLSPKLWLTILALVCFGLIGVSFFTNFLDKPLQKVTSAVVIPLQRGVNGIGLWITGKSDLFATVSSLQEKNAELQKEIEALKQENLRMQEDKVELADLRKLYALDNVYADYKTVGANVIGRNSDNWYDIFTIDKGSAEGIKKDMNVIAGNGLVGIVYAVSDHYALVRTIIDDASNVSAMPLNTSDICAVRGDLQLIEDGYLLLSYLDKNVLIEDGDMIVTSNISQKFLPGILIGYAKNVTKDPNALTQSGYVVPVVDFKHIKTVLVITELKSNPAADEFDEKPNESETNSTPQQKPEENTLPDLNGLGGHGYETFYH